MLAGTKTHVSPNNKEPVMVAWLATMEARASTEHGPLIRQFTLSFYGTTNVDIQLV